MWQSARVDGAKRSGRRRLTISDYPLWLAAIVAVAFLVVPWTLTLALARHHHLDATAVGILASVSIPLSALWVAWVALAKGAGSGGSANTLNMVADRLATAVRTQWEAEARAHRLNDPYPLPVSWAAADESLTDAWDSLVRLASSGAGWPAVPPAGTWAAAPHELAGEGGELGDVLTRVPTGRLVVLGEPGAGKTMLMVRLVLDLLARRTNGGSIPFLASVASWDPTTTNLRDWLGTQLLINYPALASASWEGAAESTQAEALLASELILPVLDGLDEIPEQGRAAAIRRINDELRPGEQLVLTCRRREYQDAVRPVSGHEVTLRGAAAVQLRPLDADAVRNYLCDDAAGPVARARWDPVFALLGTQAPTGQALKTPLMVSMARTIYNSRPGELVGALRDPIELCNPAITSRAAVEAVLFDAFIPAAYRNSPSGRYNPQDVDRWLVFLARHLEETIRNPDLAWWQLPLAVPSFALNTGIICGILYGAVYGLMADVVFRTVAGGAAAGVVTGAIIASSVARRLPTPIRRIWTQPPSRRTVIVVVALGVAAVTAILAIGIAVGGRAGDVLLTVTSVAVVTSALAGVVFWAGAQQDAPLDLRSATSPAAGLTGDRKTVTTLSATYGTAYAIVLGGVVWASAGPRAGIVLGIAIGIVAAAVTSFENGAWPSYVIAQVRLALRNKLPRPFMDFLVDAHRHGVLRQVGAIYQFRHAELQHRLATRDADQKQANSPTGAVNA